MKNNLEAIGKRMRELTTALTQIQSVSGTAGERLITQKVHEILRALPYFQAHPEDLRRITAEEDVQKRQSVLAILRGKKGKSKKAVVLVGHTDTVGLSDYGELAYLATAPDALTQKMTEIAHRLPQSVQEDIASGTYLFGRGIFDMKAGVAALITVFERLSTTVEQLEGTLVLATVCDEEAGSSGMLSIVPELARLQTEEGMDILTLIDADIMPPEYEGDTQKYVYIGSVGKLMPSFYIVGKEAHVGEVFKGLDPNLLSSALTARIDANPAFCDRADGEVSVPPVALRQKDLKPEYSVQLAKAATLFFNYTTLTSSPAEVMAKMTDTAQDVFQEVIDTLNQRYEAYCQLIHRDFQPLPWQAKVVSYQSLYQLVKAEMGAALDRRLAEFSEKILEDPMLDTRDFALKQVAYLHQLWSHQEPVIVVYFSPPYYPSVQVKGETLREKQCLSVVESAISQLPADYQLTKKHFFPYISDMSYASAPKDPKEIAALTANMPGFGSKYTLPLEAMRALNLPVMNIGPYGKDAHQFTERLETTYSFEILPKLLHQVIIQLLTGAAS